MLVMDHVTKTFTWHGQQKDVLRDVSCTFLPGKQHVLMGPSGSGKSTLLALLSGLEVPTDGYVRCNDTVLATMTGAERERWLLRDCALMFQYPYLMAELSVMENCMVKGRASGMAHTACCERALGLLDQLGIAEYASYAPVLLSGGEQQRVALARALFLQPRYIFADEPTAHLDSDNALIIKKILKTYCRDHGAVAVITSHDCTMADDADVVVHLSQGNIQIRA